MENKELYEQLLIDGVKLSILDAFRTHLNNVNDIESLKQIKKQLGLNNGGEK
ncbi:hypothetical protein [Bacillus haynesii]|uniref:hypothetical protein n=1 Tax=Bacillus haynesii TaxID=1925021 RepID=UPI002282A7EE|nr:hypothetical protein [Bacillus haynesii]MCY7861592.1 hypothetical protein [Bacillus haynesii]MCY9153918.1 hypothetical protein [Bacillus haynesii]